MRINHKESLLKKKFGKLSVIEFHHNDKNGHSRFLCKCDCGNETITYGASLLKKRATSCGKCQKQELLRKKFGKLSVIEFVHRNKQGNAYFLCKCDCGNEVIIQGSLLLNEHTTSCGKCFVRELIGRRFEKFTVIKFDHRNKRGNAYFLCKCDCGNEVILRGASLLNKDSTQCLECARKLTELRIGKNEKLLLDAEEKRRGIIIVRQKTFVPLPYTVDGYCVETNTIFEVNEKYHDKRTKYDRIRKEKLEALLGCEFVIIHDRSH